MKLVNYEVTFEFNNEKDIDTLNRKLQRVIDSWNECASFGITEIKEND